MSVPTASSSPAQRDTVGHYVVTECHVCQVCVSSQRSLPPPTSGVKREAFDVLLSHKQFVVKEHFVIVVPEFQPPHFIGNGHNRFLRMAGDCMKRLAVLV